MQSNLADRDAAGPFGSNEASSSRPTQAYAGPAGGPSTNLNSITSGAPQTASPTFGSWRVSQGKMQNPPEIPRIDGQWSWADTADRGRAAELGYSNPIDVTLARSQGELTDEDMSGSSPNVTFTPNTAHLNPDEQPEGEGFWSFLTVGAGGSARVTAWARLGGKKEYGFEDARYPTAQQVWELRQRILADGGNTLILDDIDLAWVLDFQPKATEAAANGTPGAQPTANAPSESRKNSTISDQDPPQLPDDPKNGDSEHDQTGVEGMAKHRTIEINGQRFTCDLSTANLGKPEPHKLEIPDTKGNWVKWKHAGTMDWNSRANVRDLNAWRDQKFSRGGWPKKRKDPRPLYTDEQKRWAFEYVSKNEGTPPGQATLKKMAADFQERFGEQRSVSAMSSLCSRLTKIYKENDGKFVVGPKRGQVIAERAAAKKREREESEEVLPPRKKKRMEGGSVVVEDEEDAGLESGDEGSDGEDGEQDAEALEDE